VGLIFRVFLEDPATPLKTILKNRAEQQKISSNVEIQQQQQQEGDRILYVITQ